MHLSLLKTKIHRATVTHSELNYEGSIAIDGLLLDATGIRSSAFMVLYAWVWLSLIWMYWAEMRRTDVVQRKADARG